MSTIESVPQAGDIRKVVASEVKALLGRYDLTQSDLATHLEMTQSQVSKRLRGAIPFNIVELQTMAEYFNVSVAQLLGEQSWTGGPGPGERGHVTLDKGECSPLRLIHGGRDEFASAA